MNLWPILQENLEDYKKCSTTIKHCLASYERECSDLIEKISKTSFDSSAKYFDSIFGIQNILAIAKYKYEFHLGGKLDDIVYYFERDDIENRKFLYAMFCSGKRWPSE